MLEQKWHLMMTVNKQIDDFITDITNLNKIWSTFMSVFFAIYIFIVVYFGYHFFFIKSVWEQKAFFSSLFLLDIFTLFFVIAQMASVVRNHATIETFNDRLCQHFTNFNNGNKEKRDKKVISKINLKILIKVCKN